jgi:hypothetical protein
VASTSRSANAAGQSSIYLLNVSLAPTNGLPIKPSNPGYVLNATVTELRRQQPCELTAMLFVKRRNQTVDACVEQSYLAAWLFNTVITTALMVWFASIFRHIITILHTLFEDNSAMIIHYQMSKLFWFIQNIRVTPKIWWVGKNQAKRAYPSRSRKRR